MFNIAVLSVGFGNPNSIINMFRSIGLNSFLVNKDNISDIKVIDLLVIPGVGSFDAAINGINEEAKDFIVDFVASKKPLLGICIGMHILFDRSEEGVEKGLSLIPGQVVKFDDNVMKPLSLPIPHVGWNHVHFNKNFLINSEQLSRFYFTHSYHAQPDNKDHIAGYCNYGNRFVSMVNKDNVFGVQFHPEKSNLSGQEFFKRFINFLL